MSSPQSILSRYPALARAANLPTCLPARPSRMVGADIGPFCPLCGDPSTGRAPCDLCTYEGQAAALRAPDLFTLGVELTRMHAANMRK